MSERFSLVPAGRRFDETIEAGAIVGLAGLDGHGQDVSSRRSPGLKAPGQRRGRQAQGRASRADLQLQAAAANGVAYLPRDRRTMGIFPDLSVLDNFAHRYARPRPQGRFSYQPPQPARPL